MFTNDKRVNITGAYWEMTKEIVVPSGSTIRLGSLRRREESKRYAHIVEVICFCNINRAGVGTRDLGLQSYQHLLS